MRLKQSRGAEQALGGTRHRVVECRKRLRRARAMKRALRIEQDEAVIAASEILANMRTDIELAEAEEVFEEAGAINSARQFAPEVDRRTRLRAR